ncbi:unnamed protein product [Caenorhabditis brenneri]
MTGKCAVCHKPSNSFNYGIESCGACKVFFRRTIIGKPVKACRNSKNCQSSTCRLCRLQKCIQAGMIFKMSKIQSDQDSLTGFLNHLKELNSHRNRQIFSFRFDGDPTVEEIVKLPGPILFETRPKNYEMSNIEGGNFVALTTIDYMKKFNFLNLLDLKDRVLLIENSITDFDMLSNAFRSFESKKACSLYPDGSDIFLKIDFDICKTLENKIRCELVGRLCELEITIEEFLLLTTVFFCNPAISNLTETGKTVLTSHQKVYTSLLFQYCLLKYQQNGPNRFTNLLSLFSSAKNAHKDIGYHYFLCNLKIGNLPFRKLFNHEYPV